MKHGLWVSFTEPRSQVQLHVLLCSSGIASEYLSEHLIPCSPKGQFLLWEDEGEECISEKLSL